MSTILTVYLNTKNLYVAIMAKTFNVFTQDCKPTIKLNFFKLCLLAISCIFILITQGCSTLPKTGPEVILHSRSIDTSQTTLAQIISPLRDENPGLTGYFILDDPLDAISARLRLIDHAQKTLDLQYYIWNNDKIGALALHAIIQAADRGVKVRLLIDDNNAKPMEDVLLALSKHPNIHVKLFNPYKFRKFRGIDMVLDLKRINRRMHNKTFIADNQIALIGGRNITNQYYNVSDNYQFSDVDVILVGTAVNDIVESFDDFWNDSYAYSIENIVKTKPDQLTYNNLKQQLNAHYQLSNVQNYLNLAAYSHSFDNWLHHNIQLDWVKAKIVKDSPSKIRDQSAQSQYVSSQLAESLDKPAENVDLVSAYFVPEKEGASLLSNMAKDGIQVRVLTNSFKATDVSVVHAFYQNYRKNLLENGVQVYEYLPAISPEDLKKSRYFNDLVKKAKVKLKGLSRSSLHAKLMAIDQRQVFIGSYNYDPRSARLNTEIGVILDSPPLAKAVHSTMDKQLNHFAYKLVLDANNNINWHKQTDKGIEIYTKEPGMKWWQRMGLKMLSWLPIEGYM